LKAAYKVTSRRLLVFDYGGTLRENERVGKYIKDDINPCHKGRDLPDATIEALRRLSEDPNNAVYIISGLALEYMIQPFRDVPKVGLVAQNGLCYSLAAGGVDAADGASLSSSAAAGRGVFVKSTSNDKLLEAAGETITGGRRWYLPDFGVDWPTVKAIALPIMHRYTGRTNGSSIRYREPTLAWSYYRSDPEWGILQASKLWEELNAALSPFNVQIQHDRGELEIVPKFLHKGTFVKRALSIASEMHHATPDFIFVIGDDVSDEKMFSTALSFVASQSMAPPPSDLFFKAARSILDVDGMSNSGGSMSEDDDDENPFGKAAEKMLLKEEEHSFRKKHSKLFLDCPDVDTRVITCTVGKKSSIAGSYVESVKEVETLLLELTRDL